MTQGFPFQISSHSFGAKSMRQYLEQKAFVWGLRTEHQISTKGLQQFLNGGEILMLEGNQLKIAPGCIEAVGQKIMP